VTATPEPEDYELARLIVEEHWSVEAVACALADTSWNSYQRGKHVGRRLVASAIRDQLDEDGL
jgi:hypothetical protein